VVRPELEGALITTEVAQGSATPAPSGLTEAEAARRLAAQGPNTIREPAPPGALTRVLVQLRDPMILLLIGAAVLTVALRDLTDTAVIAVVVVLNTAVGVVQELRAERALAALRRLAAPVARVVRDGRAALRPADQLVPGDVIRLEAGDVVPADASLVEAYRLQADEAALTGESVAVEKDVAEGEVYAGTVVTRGRGVAVVTRTGPDSALGRIAELLADQRPRPTPLQQRLAALGRTLSLVAVALSGLVLVSGLVRGQPAGQMVVTAVSLAVAAVPESLPAVVTLALALGAHRMARRAAVVRRLPAVETLGSVTVLAADKTGTLTEGRMVAERLWTPDGEYVATGGGYDPDGSLHPAAGLDGEWLPWDVGLLLRDVVLCSDASLQPPTDDTASWTPVGDPTEAALVAVAAKGGVHSDPVRQSYPRESEIPFDSVRKRMTTVLATPEPGEWLVVCKGAPEVVLGTPGLLDDDRVEGARAAAADLSVRGYRVLAVAHRLVKRPVAGEEAEQGLRLAGLVAIIDPPRANAAEVVGRFREAGVDLLLITGDHPGTAGALASRVGMTHRPDEIVTGPELERGLSPARLAEARVFARTRPEQKLDIVRAWQDRGHVVAMTGDGVNDAPALRRADIGVAMGRDGTEVARQAADLVLMNDDLGTVVAAIEEGRRIYANVRTFLRYALSGGLAEVLVMLTGPFAGLAVPLLPAQILWINMLTHGLPGVALGAEPGRPDAMQQRPRSPDEFVLGSGLWRRIAWTGLLIAVVSLALGVWAYQGDRPWQTMIFLVLGLAQLGVALALRRPRADRGRRLRFLDVAVAGAVLLQLAPLVVPPLRALLGVQAVGLGDLAVVVAAAAVPGLVVRATRARSRPPNRRAES